MTSSFCEKHWTPIRDEDLNGVAATALLVTEAAESDVFRRALHLELRRARRSGGPPHEAMNRVMERLGPACCWIKPVTLEAIMYLLRTDFRRHPKPPPAERTSEGAAAYARAQVEELQAWQASRRHRPEGPE